jgi:hypothetical protein
VQMRGVGHRKRMAGQYGRVARPVHTPTIVGRTSPTHRNEDTHRAGTSGTEGIGRCWGNDYLP